MIPRLLYTQHAKDALAERGIEREWVERTLDEPEALQAQLGEPGVWRAFRAIPERQGRVLRVVWRQQATRSSSLPRFSIGAADMKTLYDPEADALYVRFVEAAIVESEEVAPGFVLDRDAEGRIVAVEILDTRRHLAEGAELPTAAE